MHQNNNFVVIVKLNCIQTHCIDDQDKFQSVTDTGNEFTECQTPRKKFQSIGISPVSLHTFMKTLKSNISEVYKVQPNEHTTSNITSIHQRPNFDEYPRHFRVLFQYNFDC